MKRTCSLYRWFAALGVGCAASLVVLAQPDLVSVEPDFGATDVPVDSAVVFTFSTPMDRDTLFPSIFLITGSIQWSANLSQPFDYQWSNNDTVLTATYSADLPGDSVITWEFNPAGGVVQLSDLDYFPLAPTSGSFTTGSGVVPCNPEGVPESFGSLFLSKTVAYLQTSAASPLLDPVALPSVIASAESPANDAISAAHLQTPLGAKAFTNLFGRFFIMEEFSSEAELDAAWPSGAYAIDLVQQSGAASVPMTMPDSYPPIPQIANYAAAQSIDPTVPFTLIWNGFTGATASDRISLVVFDEFEDVFTAPDLCVPIELPVTATSITLPAGTLADDKTYDAHLAYIRGFYYSSNNPAQFLTAGSLSRTTSFTLNTGGSISPPRPEIGFPALPPGAPFQFTLSNLLPGTTYQVDISPSLQAGSWTFLESFTATGTEANVEDDTAQGADVRYYRVVAP